MDKMKIWFNHWFSTAYHLINLMKAEERDKFIIVGSNKNPDSVVKLACDEWYTEPDNLTDEEYLEYCLNFCNEHNIDVFVPRREMTVISKNANLFEKIGIKLFVDTDYEMIKTLKNKSKAYKYFSEIIPQIVPIYFEVDSFDLFVQAYSTIKSNNERVCFKFVDDEGAVSFRVIDNSMQNISGLYKAPGMKISYDTAISILSDYNFRNHLIVMPYLSGVEVSVDCLNTPNGAIIIPRFKSGGRIYDIKYDETILTYSKKFLECSKLNMPCNIQFKYHDGKPYLLEVNTRMSGGLQVSCMATGVNIPNIALNKLLGVNKKWNIENKDCKMSYIENPIKLE